MDVREKTVTGMAEYIEREAAQTSCRKYSFAESYDSFAVDCILKSIPAADVATVRHGRWLDRPKNQGLKDEEIGTVGMVDGEPWSSCYCSECGEWLVASDEYAVKGNYCPNCGADMRGSNDE